jgi:hypothetical protein
MEVGQMWLIFVGIPTANPTQQDPHIGEMMISFQNHQLSSSGHIRTW